MLGLGNIRSQAQHFSFCAVTQAYVWMTPHLHYMFRMRLVAGLNPGIIFAWEIVVEAATMQLCSRCFVYEQGLRALDVVVGYKSGALMLHQDHPFDYSFVNLLSSSA